MRRRHFHLLHSVLATVVLLALEALLGLFVNNANIAVYAINVIAIVGGIGIIVVAVEAIEEVKNTRHMLFLLTAVLAEFVVFFSMQYWYISLAVPGTFAGLSLDPVTLLLHSTMIFAFNPLYMPTTLAGRALMLINTLESMGLVIFVLQNIWQFRAKEDNNI